MMQLYDKQDSIVFADRIFPVIDVQEKTEHIPVLPEGENPIQPEEKPAVSIPSTELIPATPVATHIVSQRDIDDQFLSGNALRFRVSPGNHTDTRIQKAKFQVSLIGYTGTGTLELYRDTLAASNLVASTPITPVTDPTSSSLSQDITLSVDAHNTNAITEQHSTHEFIVVIRDL